MARTFKDALASRYEAIKINTVREGEYGEYKVADLIAAYGSRRELAEAYAEGAGIKYASALKALSRLERYERGERGGDIRSGIKALQENLTYLGSQLPAPSDAVQNAGAGESGMGGGSMSISGVVGVSGYGDDYDEDRDIEWDFTEEELDTMAIEAWDNGEEAASNYYGDIYGFDGMNVVDADIDIY